MEDYYYERINLISYSDCCNAQSGKSDGFHSWFLVNTEGYLDNGGKLGDDTRAVSLAAVSATVFTTGLKTDTISFVFLTVYYQG